MTRIISLLILMLGVTVSASAATRVSRDEDSLPSRPRVALCGDKYFVVWLVRGPVDDYIWGARVNCDLSGQPEYLFIELEPAGYLRDVQVATKADTALVVYEWLWPMSRTSVISGRFVYPNGHVGVMLHLSPLGEVDAFDHRSPTVSASVDSFLVAWNYNDTVNPCVWGVSVHADTPPGHRGWVRKLADSADCPSLASDGQDFMMLYVEAGDSSRVRMKVPGSSGGHFTLYEGASAGTPDVAYHSGSGEFLAAFRDSDDDSLMTRFCGYAGPTGDIVPVRVGVDGDSFDVCAGDINLLISFQEHAGQPPNDTCRVIGQRVNAAGQLVGPAEPVDPGNPDLNHHDPHVAWDGSRYGVVWQQLDGDSSAIYIDTVPAYQRHFYSRSEHATAFNQSQNIFRIPNSDDLHVVYMTTGQEPEDSVLYTRSTNNGEDWFPYEYVGAGRYPAVIVNDVGGGLGPWVAYVTADSSLVQAIRQGESDWFYDTIFDALPVEQSVGPPSYAPCYLAPQEDVPAACAVYPVYISSGNCEIHFRVSTQLGVEYDTVLRVSSTADFPCVAVTPGDIAHVSWQEGEEHERAIYYMAYGEGGWSDTARVSTPAPQEPTSEPADHASLEAYGDRIYCAWRGPADPGDIWRNSRQLGFDWGIPDTQNTTADSVSDHPVMTTDYLSVWQEEVDASNYDIWGRFGEDDPAALFETDDESRFPHVTGYWLEDPDEFHCHTVWTESTDVPGVYEVRYERYVHVPQDLDGPDYEPGSFYAVEVGGPKPSPYCTRRGGFREYRSFRTDTSASELTYVLPYLDPRCTYLLRAVFYHEGKGSWSAELRGDSSAWAKVTARPNVPETVWVRIPQQTYRKDAQVEFSLRRVSGSFVSLAGLKLFQKEFRDKGFELAVFGGRTPTVRPLRASPSPFTARTSICYNLAVPGRARVDVLDATGRVVCKLVDAELEAGEHRVSWKGRDEQGRAVAAGVYFCRLLTPDTAAIDRVVLLR